MMYILFNDMLSYYCKGEERGCPLKRTVIEKTSSYEKGVNLNVNRLENIEN
jgi:hypothetical protein